MVTRREWLERMVGAGAMLALDSRAAFAGEAGKADLITRPIPSTGERLPIVGLGSSATFAQIARSEDVTALRAVLGRMVELGGTVFDTAPAYGASEEVAGRIAQDLGIAQRLFWATKLNVARRGGAADPAAARGQVETSFRRIGKPVIDLIQVHNMGDVRTQLPVLREYKERGRVRYIGVTTTFGSQYPELVQTMRNEPIDFIGTDYAIDNRHAEETILPLAQDRGIAVLVYAPFGRTRLWSRVAGRKVPDWAREFDARSWAQFFLKYAASHAAVTAITPATSRAANMADNMGGATGRLPDEAMKKRMIELVDAFPAA
jgi:aryl-alcohol dehydrogenase-like predicted oxidoreductase